MFRLPHQPLLILVALGAACGANETTLQPSQAPQPTPQSTGTSTSAVDAGLSVVSDEAAGRLAAEAENMPLAVLGGGPGVKPKSGDSSTMDLSKSDGGASKVKGPEAQIHLQAGTTNPPIGDYDRVVAGLRPRLRQCYQIGLNSDPSMTCKVMMTVKIAPSGDVSSASVASNSGASQTVAACFEGVFRRAQFTTMGGGGATGQTRFECARDK